MLCIMICATTITISISYDSIAAKPLKVDSPQIQGVVLKIQRNLFSIFCLHTHSTKFLNCCCLFQEYEKQLQHSYINTTFDDVITSEGENEYPKS